ncbi:olfactory receptor class A-like protein 1 [Bombina bombina]|uniref:olfactory receptor class A-like protein 1 n=1 Tax=Bombina bombina TaxID=8345 RepID=UPI00235A698D|nr:olfactory receptor class A-like protein 1 [Bombina bombina]
MENRLLKAIEFIPLVVIGVPGNIFILVKFAFVRILEKKLLPTNLILMVLASVNLIVLVSRVIPLYLYSVGLEEILNDALCKLTVFTYRVCRALSISFTSLLSCHQCILIAPSNRHWSYLKQKVSRHMLIIIMIVIIINFLLYPSSFLYAHEKNNSTSSPYTLYLVTCRTDFLTYVSFVVNGLLLVVKDFILVGLMTLASSYIVNVLFHHGKTVKGIRSSDSAEGKSVEYKASRAVILLVVLYVVLFGLDNSLWLYTLFNSEPDLNDARIVLSCSYSALSPIVIITTNPKLQCKPKLSQSRLQSNTQKEDREGKLNSIS